MARTRKSGLPDTSNSTAGPLTGSAVDILAPSTKGRKPTPRAAFAIPQEFIDRVERCTRHDLDEIIFHGGELFHRQFLPSLFARLKEDARQRLDQAGDDDQGKGPHAPNLRNDGSGEWLTPPEQQQAQDEGKNGPGMDPDGHS